MLLSESYGYKTRSVLKFTIKSQFAREFGLYTRAVKKYNSVNEDILFSISWR